METSFLKSNHKSPFERFSTESPVTSHYFPVKSYKTQENFPTRTDLEEEFNDKMATMKHFYQLRLRNFEESLSKLYQRLFDDELMKTLKKDAISADFINERVREIFQEIVSNDKEILLTNITAQYANLKHELKRVEAEKTEIIFQCHKEITDLGNRVEDLGQELDSERKIKEELINENVGFKSKCEDMGKKLKYESIMIEEEKQKMFESRSKEFDEVLRDKSRKEEDLNRISLINIEMHKNLQMFKQEKEEFARKSKDFEGKLKILEEENVKLKRKNDELEAKVNELKEKLTKRNNEINVLRFEKKQEFDQSFKIEKENILKYEEFHQMIGVMEEKLEGQKKHYKEKKRKFKEKLDKYKKNAEKNERIGNEIKDKLEREVKRVETEKNAIFSQKNELEGLVEELKKKHLNILGELSQKQDENLEQNQRKFTRVLELNIEKLKNEHNQELTFLRSELERTKRLQEEFSNEQNTNFIKKSEHFRIVEDLESLLEDLKKEIEEKGLTFHRESLEKQRFYEEKYQKDFELLQKTANQKVQFFEEKYKEELEAKNSSNQLYTKLEENYKKILREKALLEQDLLSNKSLEKTINSPRIDNNDNKKTMEKLMLKNEDLISQNSVLTEKNTKNIREIQVLKRKIEENLEEINKLTENLQIYKKKLENSAEEFMHFRNKANLLEKNQGNTLSQLKHENSHLEQEIDYLKSRNNELSQKNNEFLIENKPDFTSSRVNFKEISSLEEKLREKIEEISIKDVKIAKLEKSLRGLEEEFIVRNNENTSILIEKKELKAKITRIKRLMNDFKEKIYRNVQRKLEDIKKDNMELKLALKKAIKIAQNDLSIQSHFSIEILRNSLKKKEENMRLEIEKTREFNRNSLSKDIGEKDFEIRDLKDRVQEFGMNRKQLESELQSLLIENTRMKQEIGLNNERKPENLAEIERIKSENARYSMENARLQGEIANLQDKLTSSMTKSDKNEENRRLLTELMQLRAAIDTLYTKHKQILEEVTLDIERLKEKQGEEISHINQNYTEMINVMTEKLENFRRDDTSKSTNLVKMSQRIDYLEKAKQHLENKLNYSAEIMPNNNINDNPVKSYESPSLKSGRNVPPTIENSRLFNNKSEGGDLEKLYEHFESKEKSDILEPLNYYGGGSNNKNIYYSSISRDTDENPNNMNNNSKEGTNSMLNEEIDNKKIRQFTTFDPLLEKEKEKRRPQPYSQREVDDLKNLLGGAYKNLEDNNETKKKFNEEADNLYDKIKELQKMHEFLGASSLIKKSGNWSSVVVGHKSSKSNDSPDFPNYTEKLAQLYSPISVKPSLDRDENMKI